MNNDVKMLIAVAGRLGHLQRSTAVGIIAEERGLTKSGVSGMVTRAAGSVAGKLALMEYRSNNIAKIAPSQQAIDIIVNWSRQALRNSHNASGYAVFMSDIHFPKQDTTALALLYAILDGLDDRVVYWSALNDALDFAKLSHWQDRRSLRVQALEEDIATTLEIHDLHLEIMREVCPSAVPVGMVGNHTIRIATANDNNGLGLWNTAQLMKRLYAQGVIMPGALTRENVWQINDSLVWSHGWFAAANRVGNMVKNYKQAKRELASRSDFEFVIGHTHAQMETRSDQARLFNAGHLCQAQPEYSRRLMDWQPGVVISKIGRGKNDTRLIPFQRNARTLSALNPFNGRSYEANINAFSIID